MSDESPNHGADMEALAPLWCTDTLPDVGRWTVLRAYRSGSHEAGSAMYAELVPPPKLQPTQGLGGLVKAFASGTDGATPESVHILLGTSAFLIDDRGRQTAIFARKNQLVCVSSFSLDASEAIPPAVDRVFEVYEGTIKLARQVLKEAERSCKQPYDPLKTPQEWAFLDSDAGIGDVSPYLTRTLAFLRSRPERPIWILSDDERIQEKARLLRYFRNPAAWRFADVGRRFTPVAREQGPESQLWTVRVDGELADPDIILLRYDSMSPFVWLPEGARVSHWCGLVDLIANAMRDKREGRSVDVEAVERQAETMCRGLLFAGLDLRRNLALLRDEDA